MQRPSTFIIAEAGVNHNGDFKTAKKMIDVAKQAGADAVKFQSFIPEQLVTQHAPKADYQIKNTGANNTQLEMLRGLALSGDEQYELMLHCQESDIEFLSSPFDLQSMNFLINKIHSPCIKIGSGELTNGPLLFQAANAEVRIILSTGMSTISEIQTALGVLAFGYSHQRCQTPTQEEFVHAFNSKQGQRALQNNVTLLHCTSEYPCPYDDVNLFAMDTLRDNFKLNVGFSDHTPGITIALAAVARGATVVEKHFTLDRALPGPDQNASIEPDELDALVKNIRYIEAALGSPIKSPADSEEKTKLVARKKLVAACSIVKGEAFTAKNIAIKRTSSAAGIGNSPMDYWQLLSQNAERDYDADEVIES